MWAMSGCKRQRHSRGPSQMEYGTTMSGPRFGVKYKNRKILVRTWRRAKGRLPLAFVQEPPVVVPLGRLLFRRLLVGIGAVVLQQLGMADRVRVLGLCRAFLFERQRAAVLAGSCRFIDQLQLVGWQRLGCQLLG